MKILMPYQKDKIRKKLIDSIAKRIKEEQEKGVFIQSFEYGDVNDDDEVNVNVILNDDTFYVVKYDLLKEEIVDIKYKNHPYYS